MYLINPCADDVAATLKTSNHRWGNITEPEGGRAEMGVLYEYDCSATKSDA